MSNILTRSDGSLSHNAEWGTLYASRLQMRTGYGLRNALFSGGREYIEAVSAHHLQTILVAYPDITLELCPVASADLNPQEYVWKQTPRSRCLI